MLTQHVYGLAGRARISGQERLGPRGTKLAATRLGFIALGATLP
ncbi:hypothetical protein OG429_32625 [Streptomyces sp. NBC_00190]|nr:hypothetical protein [Streptomyces sp. NBC_00190]